ncbi:MAG: hypothetical protein PVSMB2_12180 [Ktedonobacteraceae bacterium]
MNTQEHTSDTTQSSLFLPVWRTEPEIAHERQNFLRQRLKIPPNIQQGIYPFKDVQLTRADIEWLLATHEQGRGPIDWSDHSQRARQGIDLRGADLRHAICDNATTLEKVTLFDKTWGCVLLADIHWGDCNLALLDWRRMVPLGDDTLARSLSLHDDSKKPIKEKQHHLDTYQAAARANRQLANAMRAQGMNEEAMPFAYRAQVLQRAILWRHLLWGTDISFEEPTHHTGIRQSVHAVWDRIRTGAAYLFSWFLDILAGYGYKPERSVIIYVLTVLVFTIIYLFAGTLPFREALVFSITAFHGRGFLPGPFKLGSLATALAACEAIIGLFIEISFIATFTQRFFGR